MSTIREYDFRSVGTRFGSSAVNFVPIDTPTDHVAHIVRELKSRGATLLGKEVISTLDITEHRTVRQDSMVKHIIEQRCVVLTEKEYYHMLEIIELLFGTTVNIPR